MSTNICYSCLAPISYNLIYSENICTICHDLIKLGGYDEIVYINNVPVPYTLNILESDIHREGDFPAIIHVNGFKEWYKNGKIHRDGDLPSSIWPNGTKEWNKNGLLHREGDKPAIIYYNGIQEWYKNGKMHRDGDNPAFFHPDGRKHWCKNGKVYKNFKLENSIALQLFITFIYSCKTNKNIWSPDKIAGKFTKKQLFNFISPKN
jgi:hypothetical protein